MARLTKIGVGGFKSIKDLKSLSLRPINVLVGANGAGKSNLISFLRLLTSIPALKLQNFVARAGGANTLLWYGAKQTPAMWGALDFESKTGAGRYMFRLAATAIDSLIFSDEQVQYAIAKGAEAVNSHLGSGHRESLLIEGHNYFNLPRELLSSIRVFHFEDTSETAPIGRRGYIEDNRSLRDDGGNLAAFLFGLRQREPIYYQRIVSTIRLIAPFFDDFELAPMAIDPNSIILNWKDLDSDHVFGPHQLSDGTLRAMALVALLRQPESELPGLIVLDEPEIGLHPYALEILAALGRYRGPSENFVPVRLINQAAIFSPTAATS